MKETDWWKESIFYQVYPRSFKDTNGDGIGDLKGLIQQLDYIQQLGVTAIWLNPIFTSPQVDNGYDVSDYYTIDPIFGTVEDAIELIKQAHKRELKVIFDLVVNHTSDQHVWFQEALKDQKIHIVIFIFGKMHEKVVICQITGSLFLEVQYGKRNRLETSIIFIYLKKKCRI